MRKATQEETNNWMSLAKEHGFIDESGGISIGRFVIESFINKRIVLKLITPLIAPLYTHHGNNLKSPPILFDRTPDGLIIIPGRWWAGMFDSLSEHPVVAGSVRDKAIPASRVIKIPDALLPPDTDTISFLAPDDNGKPIPFEALPPGGKIVLNLPEKEDQD
jgi:hypothetical protein